MADALTAYKFRFRDSSGDVIAELGYSNQSDADSPGLAWLNYHKHIRLPGIVELMVSGNLPWLAEFDEGGQVDVLRQVPGEDWYREVTSINVGDWERTWPQGRERFHYRGPGEFDVLARVGINWKANTANRSAFSAQPGETVMKRMVQYNASADATAANGRELDRAGAFAVTVAADGGAGTVRDWYCAWDSLIENLADFSRVAGGDYSLTRDATDALSWEFDFHAGQRGVDRTATVKFSLALGNMGSPQVRRQALGAPNVAVVGGPGQGEEREITVVYAADYVAARHREVFINATDAETDDARTAAGLQKLAELRPRTRFEWEALQIDGCRYGLHYCEEGVLGDLVTVERPDDGSTETHKIVAVSVGLARGGGEKVQIYTEEQ